MKQIRIVTDFTPFPGGRYRKHGKGSGQEFREDFLVPILRSKEVAEIDLEGASGYPPSFLEEAFGGLVREGFSVDEIRKRITLKASGPYGPYEHLIWGYIEKAAAADARH